MNSRNMLPMRGGKLMNKKLISQVTNKNLIFLIMSVFATITFMTQVTNALYTIIGSGTLNSVEYTLFLLKIDVTRGTYNHIYTISNYPLIPIFAGVIYNIYIWIKIYRNKDIVST